MKLLNGKQKTFLKREHVIDTSEFDERHDNLVDEVFMLNEEQIKFLAENMGIANESVSEMLLNDKGAAISRFCHDVMLEEIVKMENDLDLSEDALKISRYRLNMAEEIYMYISFMTN